MIGLLIRHGQAHEQSSQLVRAMVWAPLSAVYCSPVAAAVETAQALARDHGLEIRVRPALTDTGGETLTIVQRRVVDELMTLSKTHPDETIALVTHSDPIRCALAAFSDSSLSDLSSVEITPTHVSSIGVTNCVRSVLGVNQPAHEVAV